ncbi:hypothetical protein ABZ749_25435 [Micromonospora sp. NPDC047753]
MSRRLRRVAMVLLGAVLLGTVGLSLGTRRLISRPDVVDGERCDHT